ncbi:hypothetical protein V6V47_24065 [Micromonospora sp. CPCC 205539]|uniref:hypothetical protein n=1 Tax=Micromonospora sp. CPCC 205539 TaxID=3122408 RepID=UPI002FF28B00
MSVTVAARTAERSVPAPRVATLTLAITETRILVRSVTLWASALVTVALGTVWGWTRMPTWDTIGDNAGMAAVVLAGVLLVLGHLAVSRDHRNGVVEATMVLPAERARRTIALLVFIPVAGLLGALVLGAQLALLLPDVPAGTFDGWNLAPVVLIPPIGAALGVAVGRWLPAIAAGPLTVVTSAVAVIVLPGVGTGGSDVGRWLSPVLLRQNWAPGAPEPTGWHAAYLLALLAVVVAVAVARYRMVVSTVVAVVAVALGAVAVPQQMRHRTGSSSLPITEAMMDDYVGPAVLRCEEHEAVRYCALPGYQRWIPLWRDAVEPVARAVPAGVAGVLPVVRQRDTAYFAPSATAQTPTVDTDLVWGRHGTWAAQSRLDLVQRYVRALTALPKPTADDPYGEQSCSGAGQLRTVVALWLIAQAVPDGRTVLDGNQARLGRLTAGPAEIAAAVTLLDQPRERVTAILAAHWDAVISAAPVGDTLEPLGVRGLAAVGAEQATPCR